MTEFGTPQPSEPTFEDAFRENFDAVARYANGLGARRHNRTGEDVAQEAMIRMASQGDKVDLARARH